VPAAQTDGRNALRGPTKNSIQHLITSSTQRAARYSRSILSLVTSVLPARVVVNRIALVRDLTGSLQFA
jgi:hypothetical protein